MKDKTNGFCIVSCASLILNILLPATVWLMESCAQVMPHSCHIPHKQLSIMVRYLDCLNCVILLHVAVDMNSWNDIAQIILKKKPWWCSYTDSDWHWHSFTNGSKVMTQPTSFLHRSAYDNNAQWSVWPAVIHWHPSLATRFFAFFTLIWLISLTKNPSAIYSSS